MYSWYSCILFTFYGDIYKILHNDLYVFTANKEIESSAPEVVEDSQSEATEAQETASVEPEFVSNGEESVSKDDAEQQELTGSGSTQSTFSYEQLRAKSENPVTGIDFKRREVGPFVRLLIK